LRRNLLLALAWFATACAADPGTAGVEPGLAEVQAQGHRYLDDAAFRREALVASLTNPGNGYSQERLGAYALVDRGWDLLPVWNPRSQAVRVAEEAAAPLSKDVGPLWNGARPATLGGWIELGRRVFFAYPLRAEPALATALGDPGKAAALGIERTSDGMYPGVLRFQDVDGETRIGISCALCHSAVRGETLVVGAANRRFDFGRLLIWHDEVTGAARDEAWTARLARWGRGRADITGDQQEDPVAIPDLWGLRWQSALTQAATLRQLGPVSLAIRQETQLVETNHQRVRPPRELAWALALFLHSMRPPPSSVSYAEDQIAPGRAIFRERCARCHDNAAGGGQPVPVSVVGTDGALASGTARGTGLYRPAPLVDLDHAAPYLHNGAVATLTELLTPDRLAPDYRGGLLGPGPVPGHAFGLDLGEDDRLALETYLRSR
jgi:mono/diheme cytochrome c family protein